MHLITGVLVFLHAAVLFSAACLLPGPDDAETFLAVTFGVTHAEIELLAVWTVFSSKPLGFRITLSSIGVIFVAIVFSTYVIRTNGPAEVCFVSTIALFLQWGFMQLPFWLTKRSGWLITSRDCYDSSGQRASQFQIRHLLIWTTAIAVLFAAGNKIADSIGALSDGDVGQWVGFFGIVAIANVLMAGPFIWASLTENATLIWTGVALSSIGMLTAMEALAFRQLPISNKLLDEGMGFIVVISLVHAVTIVSALLVTRGYGLRLVQATSLPIAV